MIIMKTVINEYCISSKTARISNSTRVNLTIQISRAYCNSLDFNPLSIWTRVIWGHEIN